MHQNAVEQPSLHSNQLTLKELILKLKKGFYLLKSQFLMLMIVTTLGVTIGFLYAFSVKEKYVASTTFVLDESVSGRSSLGQYAGLASMAGVDLSGGTGGLFKEDNLLELYKSRSIIQKVLFSTFPEQKNQLIIDRYIQAYKLRGKWSENPSLQTLKFNKSDLNNPNRLKDSVVTTIINDINNNCLSVTKPDQKTDLIQVKVTSTDERFSNCFNNELVNIVSDFYIQTKTKKATQNLVILQHQTDSIRRILNGAITNVAATFDTNPNANPARQILRVPAQKKQIDVQANTALLTELIKNLELAKISLRKETPLIVVVDSPIYPLEKKHTSKLFFGLIGGMLFAFIASLMLLVTHIIKSSFSE